MQAGERLLKLTSLGTDDIVQLSEEAETTHRALATAGRRAHGRRSHDQPTLGRSPLGQLRVPDSGQGAVPTEDYTTEPPSRVEEISAGRIAVKPSPRPLPDMERTWTQPDRPGERTTLLPQSS